MVVREVNGTLGRVNIEHRNSPITSANDIEAMDGGAAPPKVSLPIYESQAKQLKKMQVSMGTLNVLIARLAMALGELIQTAQDLQRLMHRSPETDQALAQERRTKSTDPDRRRSQNLGASCPSSWRIRYHSKSPC